MNNEPESIQDILEYVINNVISRGKYFKTESEVLEEIRDHVREKAPEMVSLRECSRRTGVSYDAIRKLCLLNKIVFIKCGSKYLINFNKFCEYLNTGE